MAGIVDPSGNPVSSTGTPGPQVRTGFTSSATQQGYGQQAPARQLQQDQSQLNDALKSMNELTGSMSKVSDSLAKILESMSGSVKNTNRELRDLTRSVEAMVDDTTDIEQSFKNMLKVQKELSKNGMFDNKKRTEVVRSLEIMRKKWEDIMDLTTDTKGFDKYKKALDGIDKALVKVKNSKEDALSSDDADELADALAKAASQVERMEKGLRKTISTRQGLATLVDTLHKSGSFLGNNRVVSAFTKQMDRGRKQGEQAQALGMLAPNRQAASNVSLRQKGVNSYQDLYGMNSKDLTQRGGPMGMLDRKIADMASKNVTGMAAKMVMRGGGSGLTGMGSTMLGAAEGGLGGLLRFGSKAAGPIGVLGALAQVYDMNAEQNKKVVDNLAGGGIFGGKGEAAGDTMQKMRGILASSSFYQQSIMGQTSDKNLDVMKNIIEGGRGIGDLNRTGLDIGKASQSGAGFYGTVFKNAIYGGKPIGMSQDQSVKLTMNLLDNYQASLERTKEFFVDIEKGTRAAGISTSKYLDIVDSVSGNFDNMNRSLSATVNILSAVSRSGRLTGDRMKEMMQGMTKDNAQSAPQQMAILGQIMGTGDKGQSFIQGLQKELDDLTTSAQSGFQGHQGFEKLGPLGPGSLGAYSQALDKNKGTMDQQTYQQLSTTLDNLRERYSGTGGIIQALKQGDVAGAQGLMENMGKSATTNVGSNIQILRTAASASGVNVGDLMSGDVGTRMGAMSGGKGLALNRIIQAFGGNPQEILKANRDFGREGSLGLLQLANSGQMSNGLQANLAKQMGGRGYFNLTGKESQDQLAQMFMGAVSKGGVGGKSMTDILPELTETMDQMKNQGSELNKQLDVMNKAEEQAKQQAEAETLANKTVTTADIFAHSFAYLFDKVINVLGKILEALPFTGDKRGAKTTAAASDAIANSLLGSGISEKNYSGDQKTVQDLLAKAKAGTLTDKEYQQLDQLTAKYGDKNAQMQFAQANGMRDADLNNQGIMGNDAIIQDIHDRSGKNKEVGAKEFFAFLSRKGFNIGGNMDITDQTDDFTKQLMQEGISQGFISSRDVGNGNSSMRVTNNYNSTAFLGTAATPKPMTSTGQTAPVTTAPNGG